MFCAMSRRNVDRFVRIMHIHFERTPRLFTKLASAVTVISLLFALSATGVEGAAAEPGVDST